MSGAPGLQDFAATTSPDQGPPRLALLRAAMDAEGVDAYLVPRADRFRGEYVAPADDRLAWLTGFTGSAGMALATARAAAILVDGRYTIQVADQVDPVFAPLPLPATDPGDWLAAHLPEGGVAGYDPWLHSVEEVGKLSAKVALRAVPNLIDRVWADRPAPPDAPFRLHPDALAGRTGAEKRAAVAADLGADGAYVCTLPEDVAWLLNLRGSDVPRNPVPHAMAVLHADGSVDLFCAPGKAEGLALGAGVAVHPEGALTDHLSRLTGRVRIHAPTCPQAVANALTGAQVVAGANPIALPKARKNEAELSGMRDAHLRDAVAMARFLHWLDTADGPLTEIAVVRRLEAFRAMSNRLADLSFDTIAGAGAHGAIVHYRVTEATDAPVRDGELLLVDSGGQYDDGTTDITRTVARGAPGAQERAAFTQVLSGLIAMSRLRWPAGLAGRDIDAVARRPLWMAGRDYDHGTGHGVGAALCVHEGPAGLHRRAAVPLEPGMILSVEPGHYVAGRFGIRIENLVAVTRAEPVPGGDDDREMLAFETLTWAPIDRRLIDAEALGPRARDWLDAYHAQVLARVGPLVEAPVADWLAAACAPL
ncbi:MAG: aminopeptidase P family protein [Paracoccaceae bacterium]